MPRTDATAVSSGLLPFEQRLVLNQWLLTQFGVTDLSMLAGPLKEQTMEGMDADGVSHFYRRLVEHLPDSAALTATHLLGYDQNIVRHTLTLNQHRREPLRWKHFQYLALLFTEVYLDHYFRDPVGLTTALDSTAAAFNLHHPGDAVGEYKSSDNLRKIAFWMATGAGKTLLMHANILQYQDYLQRHQRSGELNRIILLTPNEGLSRQHLKEFQLAGLAADLFSKDGASLFTGRQVEIIDINKLKEEGKEKTISVDAFEGNNLVLVDEGHRGAGGELWMDMRNRLASQGFSFEYSATFGQAMKGNRNAVLAQEYARCILFDYSYKFFYGDGYGKDYRIFNLAGETADDVQHLYLTAGLLTFYQQMRLYEDQKEVLRPYLLERPLWIFVGASVNAVRTKEGKSVSDVVDILLFLAWFAAHANRSQVIDNIARLLTGQSGLVNGRRQELFPMQSFAYLVSLNLDAKGIYSDLLQRVFNAAGSGMLHVDYLKGSDGEIALRIGDNDTFGVINVGDAPKLAKLCEEQPELVVTEKEIGESLFKALDDGKSKLSMLIGSRKFTEGWSSWRVCCMGLMNLGRSEGPQIIQLFGRGVRLRGYGFGLKRSRRVANLPPVEHLPLLETLNIFGVRADYMPQFQQYLEDEGVTIYENTTTILLPVVMPPIDSRLLTLRVRGGFDYKRHGPRPVLVGEPPKYLRQHRVVLNWYPKLQALAAREVRGATAAFKPEEGKFREEHIAFLDVDALYFDLVRFKHESGYYNLTITRDAVIDLLKRSDWYTLYIPPQDLDEKALHNAPRWQELAVSLLRMYVKRFHDYQQQAWEKPRLALVPLDPKSGNFLFEQVDQESGYLVDAPADETAVIDRLNQLRDAIQANILHDAKFEKFAALFFDRHLYCPLIALEDGSVVKVTPQALNPGEKNFVMDVKRYYEKHPDFFREYDLYLLRNQSRGRGVGFFQAGNFYPDFMLWLVKGNEQWLTFVDPKGILHLEGLDDDKIEFRRKIKEIELDPPRPEVHLNSYIVSVTERSKIQWWTKDNLTLDRAASEFHLLFPGEDPDYIERLIQGVIGEE